MFENMSNSPFMMPNQEGFIDIDNNQGSIDIDLNQSQTSNINNGPMMGMTQYTTNIVTNKGSSGILCIYDKEARLPEPSNCLRCGRCTQVCPAFLQPLYISTFSLKGDFEKASQHRALDCIECGSCSFICPARRPLVESIRNAKRQIQAMRRKEQEKAKQAREKEKAKSNG